MNSPACLFILSSSIVTIGSAPVELAPVLALHLAHGVQLCDVRATLAGGGSCCISGALTERTRSLPGACATWRLK